MKKCLLIDLGKYLLAIGLLAWVVRSNWAPPATKAVAALSASTVGLCVSPAGAGPLLAVTAAIPGRIESRGLGYVCQRHLFHGLPIDGGYVTAAFSIYVLAILITLFRWYILVRALDLPLRVRDALRYGFIGIFFNTFLPGSVGGDIIKAAALARAQSRRTAAVATVLMDRVIGLWALVWFVALLGGAFWLTGMLNGPSAAVAVSIVTIAFVAAAVTGGAWLLLGLLPDSRAERFADRLARLPVIGASAPEFWRAVWMYRKRQGCVALALLLSWVGQVGFVLAFFCCACALWSPELGPIPSLSEHFLLVPIGLVMQAVVPTPGGAGAGEWGFAALYLLFSASEANGVLASLVQRILGWALGLAGYVAYLWTQPGTQAVPSLAPTLAPNGVATASLIPHTPAWTPSMGGIPGE